MREVELGKVGQKRSRAIHQEDSDHDPQDATEGRGGTSTTNIATTYPRAELAAEPTYRPNTAIFPNSHVPVKRRKITFLNVTKWYRRSDVSPADVREGNISKDPPPSENACPTVRECMTDFV